jgi:hypothetical protein
MNSVIIAFLMFFVVLMIVQPVSAATGTVSIAYSGSGGAYIGDNVFFNGVDTASPTLLIKISGPGLPAAGVPLYNLSGDPGTGNPIEVNPDGTWKLLWFSSSVKGIENMQTARYYFTVQDATHPELTATASVLMKKAAFYAGASPNPAQKDDYIVLTGNAEGVTSNVKIDITDSTGTVVHTFLAPVSADGYYNYGFHVDMVPGQYMITISSPSTNNVLRLPFTVAASQTPVAIATMSPGMTVLPTSLVSQGPTPVQTSVVSAPGTGTISVASTPANAQVYLDSILMGTTPLTLPNVAAGSHQIDIKAPGYITYTVQETVKDGETATLSPTLLKSTSFTPLSPFTAILGILIFGGVAVFWQSGRRKE